MAKNKTPEQTEVKLLHVETFNKRHPTPPYVQNYIYDNNVKMSLMAKSLFREAAYKKLSRWKAEGITGIILYRSGLLPAYDEVINACHELGMYLCPMVFSFLQGEWLPSYCSVFDNLGVPNSNSCHEQELWDREDELLKLFRNLDDYKYYVKYAKVYTVAITTLTRNPELGIDTVVSSYVNKNGLRNRLAIEFIKQFLRTNGTKHNTTFYEKFRNGWFSNQFSIKAQQDDDLKIPPPRKRRGYE